MSSLDESNMSPSCEYQENLDILAPDLFFFRAFLLNR